MWNKTTATTPTVVAEFIFKKIFCPIFQIHYTTATLISAKSPSIDDT